MSTPKLEYLSYRSHLQNPKHSSEDEDYNSEQGLLPQSLLARATFRNLRRGLDNEGDPPLGNLIS